MPVLQYFGWVGSFLLTALLAANWCFPAPVAPQSDIPLDQKISIRIHTDHKWPERVVLDTTATTQAQEACAGNGIVEASLPRSRASLSPIRFTSRQEKADAFAYESGQFTAQVFRALSHQSPHQHWEQDEVHENLRGCEASFRAEGAF